MFLENFYGTLFSPGETFERLKADPPIVTALVIVALISMLNMFLHADIVTPFMAFGLVSAAFVGIIKWAFFAFFIEITASVFSRGGRLEVLLALSAFALLPWVLLGPVSLFKTGGTLAALLGVLIGFGVWIWTTVLTLFAVMKAYELSSERLLLLIFVPLFGFIIFFDWVVGFFSTMGGIMTV